MDLLTLDSTTWLPNTGSPVHYYDSLIWTEKFFEPSEFELVTHAVKHMRDSLPLWTLVAVHQSDEVMMVEEHIIDTDEQGLETLTIRGRSLTSYLKHRVVGPKRQKKYEMAASYTPQEAGMVVLYNSFVNDQAFDLTIGAAATYKNIKDVIPNCDITDSCGADTDTSAPRWIEPGVVEDVVANWFTERPHGIRIIRPPRSSCNVVTVEQSGDVYSLPASDFANLSIDVYEGTDRSHTQDVVTPVILDVNDRDLILPNYLFSIRNFKSASHIAMNDKALEAYNQQEFEGDECTCSERTGLERRVRFHDAGDPEDGSIAAEFEADTIKTAEETLRENLRLSLVDGEVSEQADQKFGESYFLGDIVSLRGKYGVITKARVSEYIRTEDDSNVGGDEGYPTLVAV
jgi:hypothetical protein